MASTRFDEISDADLFKKIFTQRAGFWPQDRAERENIFWSSPGLMISVLAGAYRLGGDLNTEEAKMLEDLFSGLLRILLQAHAGDDVSRKQLLAVRTLIFRSKYQVSIKDMEKIIKKYNKKGPLARGWEIRELMAELASFVISANPDNQNILKGPIRLSEIPELKESSLYQEAQQICEHGTTLQSLAIKIYLNRLQDKGDQTTDVRSLKRDLQKVKEWEFADPIHTAMKETYLSNSALALPWRLPTEKFSERNFPIYSRQSEPKN